MKTEIYQPTDENPRVMRFAYSKRRNRGVSDRNGVRTGSERALPRKRKEEFTRQRVAPSDNPLIVHIASSEQIDFLAASVPEKAKRVVERFMPGPVTIVLPKKEIVPDEVTGGLKTVAIRMPSSEIARKLIELSGCPICAPSANTSTRPSPTTRQSTSTTILTAKSPRYSTEANAK